MPRAIVVAGSLNMDLVMRVPRLPTPGETVGGGEFQTFPGGKGANQACAAARLARDGTTTRMIGRVGDDAFADRLRASLKQAGVDVAGVETCRANPTGVATILVDANGQNTIAVAPGANAAWDAAQVRAASALYRSAGVALFQLESPADAVAHLMAVARASGARTILDPAPARPLDSALLENTDILTPNESEALILLGSDPGASLAAGDAAAAAKRLRALGAKTVVLKLGAAGCFFDNGAESFAVPAFRVAAVDSTAAGDVFNGALAVALVEEQPWPEALRFANAAAAISVTRAGAQSSAPLRADVEAFLRR